MSNRNYFQGTKENPCHISIGAVLRNDKGEVACHYFNVFSHPALGTFEELYILMRETIEPGETIEQALSRGLMEEFGAEGKLVSFLGSIVIDFSIHNTNFTIEKTTLYFLCDLVSIDESKRKKDDPESGSEIKWMKPEDIISKMKDQTARYNRDDMDESKVLEALIKML